MLIEFQVTGDSVEFGTLHLEDVPLSVSSNQE